MSGRSENRSKLYYGPQEVLIAYKETAEQFTINRSTMKTNKQMLEDVVMVKELLQERELSDVMLELDTDKKKMPCCKGF